MVKLFEIKLELISYLETADEVHTFLSELLSSHKEFNPPFVKGGPYYFQGFGVNDLVVEVSERKVKDW